MSIIHIKATNMSASNDGDVIKADKTGVKAAKACKKEGKEINLSDNESNELDKHLPYGSPKIS